MTQDLGHGRTFYIYYTVTLLPSHRTPAAAKFSLRAAEMMGGDMIVMVKCEREEAGNILLRRTRRSTHNDPKAIW
jgi:hypothetical protein